MLGTEYTTNYSAPWSTLWVMELRLVDLKKEIHRSSLLEFAGQVGISCVAEALLVVLDQPQMNKPLELAS
ncbi:hypothetical protein PflA506_p0023 (plasmid) [Pseudomonas fluorescens A506]|nr:hypothetical protein PflA506_p0023 [Pseudomonas fluorescens A506]